MNEFAEYILLVAKRCVVGIFWLFDAISVIFFLVSWQVLKVPWQISMLVFVGVIFISSYSVWKDQKTVANLSLKQLEKIKNDVPVFEISIEEMKKFTVQHLIRACQDKIKLAQQAVSSKNTVNNIPQSPAATAIGVLMAKNAAQMTKLLGIETSEEKFERLTSHLKDLQAYELKLQHLYKVILNISSSRSETNIEVSLKVKSPSVMIVSNDYVQNNLPHTHEPRPGYERTIAFPGRFPMTQKNTIYVADHADEGSAYSKISSLNARRIIGVFGRDYYIESSELNADIDVVVYSGRRNDPQHMTIPLSFRDVLVEELQEERE